MKNPIFFLLLLLIPISVLAHDGDRKDCTLFSIGRSVDPNRIYYEVNLGNNGMLDSKEPVTAYWVKHTKGGKIADLTFIQRKLAYGLKFTEIEDTEARFHFVSYPERELFLERGTDGRYHVYMNSNGKRVELHDIFINITGGTFMIPDIAAVEIHADDAENGLAVTEIIIP